MFDFEDNELFVNAPVAYSVLDGHGRHLAANRKFWELFGYRPNTPLSVAAITHRESQHDTSSYLAALASGEQDSVVLEKLYVRADGSQFWGRVTAQRLLAGEDVLILGVIEDIDDQHQLEFQLRHAADEQSEFVAPVSHELRNPLHTIGGLAELLSASDIDPVAQRQASIILREAQSLTSIVSDLLDIGKYDSGSLGIETESFSVRSVIDRSVRAAQSLASAKGLRLLTSVDDALPIYALGAAGRLGQVIDNLLGNAVKFTAVGSVGLDARAGPGEVIEIRVSDTGAGVPADRQREIFEPFQRLNPSAPGAGLGLAISSRLATLMGGTLTLGSSGPEGSTFVLRVPLQESQAPASPVMGGVGRNERRSSRILVVEDNPETQMLASAQLDRLGYDHDVVGTGYDALDITERAPFAAILMDWHLPGIDGLETTRRIRQREAREGRARTPITSVPARVMAADVEACLDSGADDFVAKPASIGRIGEVLDRWTGRVSAPSVAGPAVDTDIFSALLEDIGDPALVEALARTFLGELPRRVATIVEAGDDPQAAQLAAHTLKSTSAMVGAEALRDIAATIEEATRTGCAISADDYAILAEVTARTEREVLELITRLENM